MEWLVAQAQNASPFVATFCLVVASILWRQHIKDDRENRDLAHASSTAMTASAVALEKGTSTIISLTQEVRETRQALQQLQVSVVAQNGGK